MIIDASKLVETGLTTWIRLTKNIQIKLRVESGSGDTFSLVLDCLSPGN